MCSILVILCMCQDALVILCTCQGALLNLCYFFFAYPGQCLCYFKIFMSLLMSSPLDSRMGKIYIMDMRWSLASLSWVRSERSFTPQFVVHVGVCVCGVVLDCGTVQERIVDCRAVCSWTVLAVQERVLDCRAPKGDFLIPFWGDNSRNSRNS